jgi:hypothetical protein
MTSLTNFKKLGNVCRAQHFGRMLSLFLDNEGGNSFNIDYILTQAVSCLCILATDIQLVTIEILQTWRLKYRPANSEFCGIADIAQPNQ